MKKRWRVKLERWWCCLAHGFRWKPTNGFGWRGYWCPNCGYSFFKEWEDWAKPMRDDAR